MQDIYELLANEIDENRVKLDEKMGKHTTFRIGGRADVFVKVETVSELEYVIKLSKERNIPLNIIREWV